MKEIPLTQGKVALVDDEDFERINLYKWHFSKSGDPNLGYATRSVYSIEHKRTYKVYMSREVLRVSSDLFVDHISHDTLDNRKCNLRLVTYQQNAANRKRLGKNNKSGFKGVYRDRDRWKASIKIKGKKVYLGCFISPSVAASAYDAAAKKHFGEFALTNS